MARPSRGTARGGGRQRGGRGDRRDSRGGAGARLLEHRRRPGRGTDPRRARGGRHPDRPAGPAGGALRDHVVRGRPSTRGSAPSSSTSSPRAGKAALARLVKGADVVLHNFLDRSARSLGIAHDQLAAINPDIVSWPDRRLDGDRARSLRQRSLLRPGAPGRDRDHGPLRRRPREACIARHRLVRGLHHRLFVGGRHLAGPARAGPRQGGELRPHLPRDGRAARAVPAHGGVGTERVRAASRPASGRWERVRSSGSTKRRTDGRGSAAAPETPKGSPARSGRRMPRPTRSRRRCGRFGSERSRSGSRGCRARGPRRFEPSRRSGPTGRWRAPSAGPTG